MSADEAWTGTELGESSRRIAVHLLNGRSRHHRPPVRPVVASEYQPSQPIPRSVETELRKLHAVVKRLERKTDDQAEALAAVQRDSDTGYSADLFRQALAAAVVNAAPAALNRDPFGAIAQFVPVIQNIRGGAASFATRPISTLAVPALALGVYALRQPRKPIIVTNPLTTSRDIRITVISPDGGDIHYTTDGTEPTKSSRKYGDHIEIEHNRESTLRVRVFLLFRASETAEVRFRKPWWVLWTRR